MAEIDDTQLDALARGFKLIQAMNGNAESRPLLEKALQKLDPKIRTTDDQVNDLLAPHLAPVKALADEMKAEREARAAERAAAAEAAEVARYEADFKRLRDKDGLTDDGEAEVRKIMIERNIADVPAAFLAFKQNHPDPVEVGGSYVPQKWSFEDQAVDTDVKGLWDSPSKWADKMIGTVLADERKQAPSY